MAISGQQNLNIGAVNTQEGSDSLYTAFHKIQDNFTKLFASSSPITTFTQGPGISTTVSGSTVTITNTGVTSITAGTGVAISAQTGNIVISATSDGNVGVTSVDIVSNTLTVTGDPIVSAGSFSVDLPIFPTSPTFAPGQYIAPTLTVDEFGRITQIAGTVSVGTVTSVGLEVVGDGLLIANSPITSSGVISIENTGVTKLNAGPGTILSGSTGEITISTIPGGQGTVTSIEVFSNNLTITGSPVTSTGNISIDIPSTISLTGNITGNYFIGNGSALTHITGASIDGYAPLATAANRAGTVTTAAQPNITSVGTLTSLTVSGDTVIGGNLTVNGTTETINSTTTRIVDPIVEQGGAANGAALSSNDSKDRGTILHYYTSTAIDAFMGWKNSAGEFVFVSNANTSSDVVTINSYGNIHSGNANLGNNASATYFTGTLVTAAQPNITSVGTLTSLSTGNVTVSTNANITLSGSSSQISGVNLVSTTNLTTSANGNIAMSGSLSRLSGANLVSATYLTGTLTTNAQPNITSVGTLTSLTTSGNVSANNATITNDITIGNSAVGTATSYDFVAGNTVTISNTGYLLMNTLTNNSKFVGFQAPSTISPSYILWQLPASDGTANTFLSTNGSGVLSFKTPAISSAPGSNSASGVAGQIAYDSGYIYVCVASNVWKRAALSTW